MSSFQEYHFESFENGAIQRWAGSVKQVEYSQSTHNSIDYAQKVVMSRAFVELYETGSLKPEQLLGNMNSAFAPIEISTTNDSSLEALLGNANGSQFTDPVYDERNKSVTSSDNPTPNQSAGLSDWNYFPRPPQTLPTTKTNRDLTRFQKSYSFTRQQPVRIRIYR